MPFSTNVFINCPFDNEYKHLLDATLFAIIYLNFEPQISETVDGGINRFESIRAIINNSKYSIHDLSRVDEPRFNMPFELGLDLGCKYFGSTTKKTKRCLIISTERYRFQQYISDIAGQDISAHNNNPQDLIRNIRNWLFLNRENNQQIFEAGNNIWLRYLEFREYLQLALLTNGFNEQDINEMPKSEYISFCKDWIIENR